MVEQAEELEALEAIYGGDEDKKFTILTKSHLQYKFGDDGEPTSFVLDIVWPDFYPFAIPEFGMDSFYNSLMPPPLKHFLLEKIVEQSATFAGNVQTYDIIEWLNENKDTLFAEAAKAVPQDIKKAQEEVQDDKEEVTGVTGASSSPKKKTEQLTKSQKRKEWDKKDGKGEVSRGNDWVDLVKHLSQTGSHEDSAE